MLSNGPRRRGERHRGAVRARGGHRQDGTRHFYAVRDGQFNALRRDVLASAEPAKAYTPALAAMLIYLNRTGYNGLFRLNSSGGFNAPAGRYPKVTICGAINLRRLSAALGRPGLTVEVSGFDDALGTGARQTSSISILHTRPSVERHISPSYTAARFGPGEQARLQQAVVRLARIGASVLLSNSVSPDIRRLYATNLEARSWDSAKQVEARRAINSRASRRGAVRDSLITNIATEAIIWRFE